MRIPIERTSWATNRISVVGFVSARHAVQRINDCEYARDTRPRPLTRAYKTHLVAAGVNVLADGVDSKRYTETDTGGMPKTRWTVCYRFEICATGDAILFPVSLRRRRTIRSPDAAIGSIGFGRSAQQGCAALRSFTALCDRVRRIHRQYPFDRGHRFVLTFCKIDRGRDACPCFCAGLSSETITVGGTRFITSCEYIIQ